MRHTAGKYVNQAAGQRVCALTEDASGRVARVRDYNPYSVQRALERQNEEAAPASSGSVTRVVTDEHWTRLDVFEDAVQCGLPYVETSFELSENDDFDGLMLDSERLIGVKVCSPIFSCLLDCLKSHSPSETPRYIGYIESQCQSMRLGTMN